MNLYEMRVIDMTGEQLATLWKTVMIPVEVKTEYVGKDEKDRLLLCRPGTKSCSKACAILKWGRENNIIVRKEGASFWNREDLKYLSEMYYKSK